MQTFEQDGMWKMLCEAQLQAEAMFEKEPGLTGSFLGPVQRAKGQYQGWQVLGEVFPQVLDDRGCWAWALKELFELGKYSELQIATKIHGLNFRLIGLM